VLDNNKGYLIKMIFIIHDNHDWLPCLKEQLTNQNLEYTDWFLGEGTNIFSKIDLDKTPPKGIFYNRVSPSSQYRGGRFSLEYCKLIIDWLERWNSVVINGSMSLEIEASKAKQCLELSRFNIAIPETYYASSKKEILDISEIKFNCKCIIKHNRSGSGENVKLVNNRKELLDYLISSEYNEPIDGITLIQKYIESIDNTINRVEIIDNTFIYAIRIDTSNGFHLCPADKCNINDMKKQSKRPKFEIIKEFEEMDLINKYIELAKKNKISICGIEFVRDRDGVCWTYDFNCNTNYNKKTEEEAKCPLKATLLLIDYFKSLL
jgi:hypothetical protein